MEPTQKRRSSRRTVQTWTVDESGAFATLTLRRRAGDEHRLLVDIEDLPTVSQYTWWIDSGQGKRSPYASATVWTAPRKTKNILMHRLLLGTPPRLHTDHRDGNGLDNRRANIRIASTSENRANELVRRMARGSSGASSKYKGVSPSTSRLGGWIAQARVAGRFTHLGTWDREIDAALAYDDAVRSEFGEFAATNFTADFAASFERQPKRTRRLAKHGTNSRYAGGCRCDACRSAAREYYRGYRLRKAQPAEAMPQGVAS